MKLHTVLLALSLPAVATTTHAATALIDFGINNSPASYNSATNPGVAGGIALTDTSSAPTGWTLTLINTGTGGFGNAGAGANAATFPAALSAFATSALQDSIFANQGGGAIQAPSMQLTLSGLNPSASYDLLLYGSRRNFQGADQRWSISQGAGGADVTHFSEDNQTTVVDWPGVTPTAGGVIEITIDSPVPGDNIGALAINFGSVTEVIPEPSATLLCALSVLGLLARRRR